MGVSANEVQEHKGDFADFGYNHNDSNSKASFEISRSSPFPTNTYPPFLPDKRYSWKRLPFGKFSFQPIRLCVLKLDGSSFDIIVTKKATVAKLKQAVEAAFTYLPKQGDGKVSWPHVWAQFCLCFEGQKLLRDRDSISRYGIQNGDRLRFVRHTPHVNNLLASERSETSYGLDEFEGSSSKLDSYRDMRKTSWNDHSNQPNLVINEINDGYVDFGANTKPRSNSKWGCTMKGLFSNRKLEGPIKGHDNSIIRLGRSFQDCELCAASSSYHCQKEYLRREKGFKQDDTMKDISRKKGSCGRKDSLFNGFTGGFGGFGYPMVYCMK